MLCDFTTIPTLIQGSRMASGSSTLAVTTSGRVVNEPTLSPFILVCERLGMTGHPQTWYAYPVVLDGGPATKCKGGGRPCLGHAPTPAHERVNLGAMKP